MKESTPVSSGKWSIGVDVGGARKGFHLAMLGGSDLYIEAEDLLSPEDLLKAIDSMGIKSGQIGAIGIDSPQNWAPGKEKSRPCEREYRKLGLSGIYFTPNEEHAKGNSFYDWVRNGLGLYALLEKEGIKKAIEVFPTGSWSRWCGSRKKNVSRAAWTKRGIETLVAEHSIDIHGKVSNQDKRDAIAAAVTAQLFIVKKAKPVEDGDSKHKASLAAGIVIPDQALTRNG